MTDSQQTNVGQLRSLLLAFAALLLILTVPGGVAARDYYVRESGRDSNDGRTPQTAWATLDRVFQESLAAGDVVYVGGGVYEIQQPVEADGGNSSSTRGDRDDDDDEERDRDREEDEDDEDRRRNRDDDEDEEDERRGRSSDRDDEEDDDRRGRSSSRDDDDSRGRRSRRDGDDGDRGRRSRSNRY